MTEHDRRGRIQLGDSDQVVDLDPLGDGVLTAGARSVCDRRNSCQGPEAVAVVDERLGALGQAASPCSRGNIPETPLRAMPRDRVRRRRGSSSTRMRSSVSRVGAELGQPGSKISLDGVVIVTRAASAGFPRARPREDTG